MFEVMTGEKEIRFSPASIRTTPSVRQFSACRVYGHWAVPGVLTRRR
jgi:hypothetical protein